MDCATNKTYTVQIGFMSEMENELLDMVKESCGITIEKTHNAPIDKRDVTDAQYLISGTEEDVKEFLKVYGFSDYYGVDNFVINY